MEEINFQGEWLVSIPNDWDQKKIKHIFNIKKSLREKLVLKLSQLPKRVPKLKILNLAKVNYQWTIPSINLLRKEIF